MKNVLYIGNKLHSSKHNISYISVLGPLLEAEGITLSYASSHQNKIRRLIHMITSIISLRSNLDVVLIDTYSTQNFYYAYIISQLCRLFKIPYIPILHGGNLGVRLKNSPRMSKRIFHNAKINVAPSLFLKEQFQSFGYTKVEHIPNVLQLQNYVLTSRSFKYPKMLWVRSFSEIYNPKLAIYTLEKLKESYPQAELCMVGPDSDGSLVQIKKLCDELDLQVKFTGKLSKSEWIELSQSYNVFMNTSNFDNMPVSVIEAMALGLPIVSTDVGGIPFLIEQDIDGILVPKNDPDAMSQAIIETINNEEKTKQRIENARHKAEQFDWKKVRSQWLDLLKNNVASS